jgi:hypothetical protein
MLTSHPLDFLKSQKLKLIFSWIYQVFEVQDAMMEALSYGRCLADFPFPIGEM